MSGMAEYVQDRSPGPRILVLSASVGSGHVRAAQAIESALQQSAPAATIVNFDVLDLTNAAFRRAYGAGYFRAVESAPGLVRWMYDFLDRPHEHRSATVVRQFFERINFTRLVRLLIGQQWDLAICTHFLPAALISGLRRRGDVGFPHAAVVTDFDVHGLWMNQPCERFFVATEETRENLTSLGVDGRAITVTGIPIDPVFAGRRDRHEAARRMHLAADAPVVLQMAGGFGVGSVERIHQSICEIDQPLQIVVVTGKNTEAANALRATELNPRHRRTILGYTDEMHDLLLAADVVVSKPGGLTSSESLACGCPMMIVEPIPGQEDRNADFLLENGCAIKANNLASLSHKLGSLLDDPDRLTRMRESAVRCARPRAALDVAAECVRLVQQSATGAEDSLASRTLADLMDSSPV
jgi:processive 1,2-diacylglycerol beta-glucosyltransferase